MTQAAAGRELLDDRGNEVLRDALAGEFPLLSTKTILLLAAEVGGTAHMIATVQWRNGGHRPGDTPEIGLSTLNGGLMIHLHASPESLPAQRCAAAWEDHAMLYKHRFTRPSHLTTDAMRRWTQLHKAHEQFMYEYWQELQAKP